MPFKSEAQRQKLKKLVEEGKFPREKYEQWEKETTEKLPARNTSYAPKEKRGKYIKGPR